MIYRAAERFLSFRILTFLQMCTFFWKCLLGLVTSIEPDWSTQYLALLYNLFHDLKTGLFVVEVQNPKNRNIYLSWIDFWKNFVGIIWPF